jgi:hypothetical protein
MISGLVISTWRPGLRKLPPIVPKDDHVVENKAA